MLEAAPQVGNGTEGQLACYTHCLERYREETDWIIIAVRLRSGLRVGDQCAPRMHALSNLCPDVTWPLKVWPPVRGVCCRESAFTPNRDNNGLIRAVAA